MASNSALAAVLFLTSFMFGCGSAATVVVGGSEGWRYGYNYTDWALKHGTFYINDTIVFKHVAMNTSNESESHSVYLLPNLYSYVQCDFSRAQLLSNPSQVEESAGFSYQLTQWRPQYFASGEGDGSADCNKGLMKFVAVPLPRWFN
ncbi:hypothetical protein SASPL_115638 [Salvia splendens]|uniref:Phytocyanin domain-containing protein n=1 Tax=Salvia splendens TaxID=180675 RepID=A0A8X8Y6X7_SALSN|nr:uncharacterized protein LOC121803625 [Salvia splendens]KAG6425212.1 hypothetical protein SASPL_115638 [Salvia splendens]